MKKTLITLLTLAGAAVAEEASGTFAWSDGESGGYSFSFTGETPLSITDMRSSVGQHDISTSVVNFGTDEKPDNRDCIVQAGSYDPYNLAVTKNTSYAPDINIGSSTTNTWTLTFTLKNITNEAVMLSGMSFDVFLFNGGGKAQNQDELARPITLTLSEVAAAGTLTELGVKENIATAGNNWHPAVNISLTDLLVIDAKGSVTLSLTASNAQVDTDPNKEGVQTYGTFVGLSKASFKVVPEPTTATLSLLALAGLAARRRRK